MSKLSLRHLYKVYPNGVKAVNDFNMEIDDKEFIVFVGPSGCGKSTTLRMIAGLEEITAGELYIGDTFSNHVEPKDRDIAMVFQNYALYPHMTVYENLAFGLRLRHVPQAEIHPKVLWAAKILKLEEYLERKPKALSGGQRQRVSLGRAILRTPKVFLLDEPLSNLDAKLRTEMRAEIAKLHQEIATTFIYVTHDQVEAMTMGTRIVVMSMGFVQQIDTPQNLYNYPENKFVAGFIGTPQMNFFKATLLRRGNEVDVRFIGVDDTLTIPFEQMLKVRPEYLNGDKQVIIGLRCEHISADEEVVAKSRNVLKIKISHFEELGNETLIYGDLNLNVHGLGDSDTAVIVKKYGGTHTCKIGDVIDVAFDMDRAHFFDAKTEHTIAPRIPKENVFDAEISSDKIELLGQTIALPVAIRSALAGKTLSVPRVLIPARSFVEGGADLTATVVSEEVINKKVITHLSSQGRVFFMLGEKQHEIGQKLSLGIDFKAMSVLDGEQTVVEPLPKTDTFVGSYFDRANAKRSSAQLLKHFAAQKQTELAEIEKSENAELAPVVLSDALLKDIKADYIGQKRQIEEEMSFELGTDGATKEKKLRIKQKAKTALAEAKQNYEKRLADYNAQKQAYNALSEQEKAECSKVEEEIRMRYAAMKAAVTSKYDKMIADVADNLANVQATLLPLEQQAVASVDAHIATSNTEFAAAKATLVAEYAAKIDAQKAKVQSLGKGEEKDIAVVELGEAKRAQKDAVAALVAEHNAQVDDILFDSKVFAAYVCGKTFVTGKEINKKIVKGLGAQLFLSHYRYELPHDAYTPSENGIPLTVTEMLDYGADKFAACTVYGNAVYVAVDKNYAAGETLCVDLDISKAKIYENKFDIRLY